MTRAQEIENQEIQDFWDDFAPDYVAIQQESQLPLTKTVTDFLKSQGILPTATLLDLGSGAGRFIPSFAPLTQQLLEVDISRVMLAYGRQLAEVNNYQQVRFIQKPWSQIKTRANQATVVFASMFDALTTTEDIAALDRLATNWVILGHFTERQSKLDQSIATGIALRPESTNYNGNAQRIWQQALSDLAFEFSTKTFYFEVPEAVSKAELRADLQTRIQPSQQQKLFESIDELYGSKTVLQDTLTYTYELLYWPTHQ